MKQLFTGLKAARAWRTLPLILAMGTAAALQQGCGGGGAGHSSSDAVKPAYAGPVTTLPADDTALYVAGGDMSSDTVVLYEQGGPIDFLQDDLDIKDTDPFGLARYGVVQVHQANTLNPAIVGNPSLGLDRAGAENDVSIEILSRVIRHFAAQGKRVYVISHSMGSMLVPAALARYPDLTPMVQRFLVMAGRLDMPSIVPVSMAKGVQMEFPDGGAPQPTEKQPDATTREGDEDAPPGTHYTNTYVLSQLKLMADIGMPRMTQQLAGRRLDKVVYAYGAADEAVGRLSPDELNFLQRSGATVYCVEGGDHTSMFSPPYAMELSALLVGTSTQTRACR